MKKTLSEEMRPKSLDEIIGHKELVGENGIINNMVKKNNPISFILYGKPGIGKTTIARVFVEELSEKYPEKYEVSYFNASVDNKSKLTKSIERKDKKRILLIVDEIHRLKKDNQDYLLPFVENGAVVMIGLTTTNPYHSVNEAIESRVLTFKLKELKSDDIVQLLEYVIKTKYKKVSYDVAQLKNIALYSNDEPRSALNILEAVMLFDDEMIIDENINLIANRNRVSSDNNALYINDLISAFQKSIRASDVDASLFYLAKILDLGELEQLLRRLIVISYEDVGLAFPDVHPRVLSAVEASKLIGLPEAELILSPIVIELSLLPKSNSAYLAIKKAKELVKTYPNVRVPDKVRNSKININPGIYNYPHNDPRGINSQRTIPVQLEGFEIYEPKLNSEYEKRLDIMKSYIKKIKDE